ASPQRIEKFERICDIMKCAKLKLIRDNSTRWNSTFAMVDQALTLRPAYQSMCQNEPMLAGYILEDDEWTYLTKLSHVLKEFNTMTVAVSASVGFPTINRAMTVYNLLIDGLEDFIDHETNDSLKEAATQGKKKLLQYYSRTDSTPVYAVATAMDPRMRFNWWEAHDWGEYAKMSEVMVSEVWEQFYKGKDGPMEMD
ncbi:hypothetical protein BGZ93_004320, partial [Podila epicladia]